MSVSFFRLIFVLVTLALVTCSVFSLADPLTPDEKKSIQNLQVSAQKVKRNVERRLSCYNDLDRSLQQKSEDLQRNAGDLHKKEKKLSLDLDQKKAETEGLNREYKEAKVKANKIQSNINAIHQRIAILHEVIDRCRKSFWIIGFFCDAGAEFSGLNNELRKSQHSLNTFRESQKHSRKQLDDARKRQAEAEASHRSALEKVKNNNEEIQTTEHRIASLKKTLEKVRNQSQKYAMAVNTFNNLLAEIDNQDIATERNYYQRKIRRSADDLSSKMDAINALLQQDTSETKDCTH